MRVIALIPIKPRAQCKQRLESALSPAHRLTLVRSMLDRVIAAARAARGIDEVVLLSDERDTAPGDLRIIADRFRGLNGALKGAVGRLISWRVDALIVLPADLPFVTSADLERLASILRAGGVALAPDHAERGTNALAAPVGLDFSFAFGVDSYRKHLRSLRAIGQEPIVIRSPGLAFDVDEPHSLVHVADLITPELSIGRRSDIRAFGQVTGGSC